MKLSKRTRYGIRMMVELARNYNKGPISLREIAKKENISEKYLEQIIIQLKVAGPIIAVRGPKGGYMLSLPPSKITLKSLFNIFEGTSGIVECVSDPSLCERSSFCASHKIWMALEEKLCETLDSITLQDAINGESDQPKHSESAIIGSGKSY